MTNTRLTMAFEEWYAFICARRVDNSARKAFLPTSKRRECGSSLADDSHMVEWGEMAMRERNKQQQQHKNHFTMYCFHPARRHHVHMHWRLSSEQLIRKPTEWSGEPHWLSQASQLLSHTLLHFIDKWIARSIVAFQWRMRRNKKTATHASSMNSLARSVSSSLYSKTIKMHISVPLNGLWTTYQSQKSWNRRRICGVWRTAMW